MGGCAPRALGDSVRPRRRSGASVRPLKFTVRRHGNVVGNFWPVRYSETLLGHFIFAWLWPIFFYTSWLALSWRGSLTQGNAFAWFFALELPVFCAAGLVASAPYRRRLVPVSHAVFWLVLVPIAIWCFLVFLPFTLLLVLPQQVR
jgi:hypothetical protein